MITSLIKTILITKSVSELTDTGDSKDLQQASWIRTPCIRSDPEPRRLTVLFPIHEVVDEPADVVVAADVVDEVLHNQKHNPLLKVTRNRLIIPISFRVRIQLLSASLKRRLFAKSEINMCGFTVDVPALNMELACATATLRYAYGDSPLGPWKSGGVLVDARAVVPNEDGTRLQTTYSGHNTHGSIQFINDQYYVFYHRAPRGFGFARQSMVAPVKIVNG